MRGNGIPALVALVYAFLLQSALSAPLARLEVANHHSQPLRGALVVVPVGPLKLPVEQTVAVVGGDKTLPAQLEDLNADGSADNLVFLVDMEPGETASLAVESRNEKFPAQVAALPMPAWESERFGFRSYGPMLVDLFARRNANFGLRLDAFYGPDGKAVHDYHKPSDLGMDILHINNTLGLAGVFLSDGEQIAIPRDVPMTSKVVAAGPVRALVEMTLGPWDSPWGEVTFHRTASIAAGQYGTELVDRVTFKQPPEKKILHGAGLRKESTRFGRMDDPDRRTVVHRFQQDEFIGLAGIGLHFPGTTQPVELAEDADNRYFAVPVGEALEVVAFGFWSGEETAAIDDLAAERAGRIRAASLRPVASIRAWEK